jgi:sodium pump decarboxylase gamma subunit
MDLRIMSTMLSQGITLMVAGMGTVLLFLSLMVCVMAATGAYFKKHAERFREHPEAASRVERISSDDSDSIAVAVAALTAYLKK